MDFTSLSGPLKDNKVGGICNFSGHGSAGGETSSTSPETTGSTSNNSSNIRSSDNNNPTSNGTSTNNSTTSEPKNSGPSNNPSRVQQSSYNNNVDGVIMAGALAGGFSLAKKSPNLAGKIGTALVSVGIGAAAIAAKNISGILTKDVGKKDFISDRISDLISEGVSDLLDLSGNSGLDLLILINTFHMLERALLLFLFYSLIVYLIPESYIDWLEGKLLKVKFFQFSLGYLHRYLRFYFKSLRAYKKSSLIIIICLLILIFICNMYAYHYLTLYIDNYEEIIKIYFKAP